jgi:hypothetical protein
VLEQRRDHHQSCKITTNVISIARSFFLTEEEATTQRWNTRPCTTLHCRKLFFPQKEGATTQWWNTRLLVVSIARSFLPQKKQQSLGAITPRVEHEQKRKIEIGYVNIDNTGNIQNSSSKEEKHSIQPVAQTNYQEVRTQENRVTKY